MKATTMESGMVMPMATVGLRLRRNRKMISMARTPPMMMFLVDFLDIISMMRDMSSQTWNFTPSLRVGSTWARTFLTWRATSTELAPELLVTIIMMPEVPFMRSLSRSSLGASLTAAMSLRKTGAPPRLRPTRTSSISPTALNSPSVRSRYSLWFSVM